MEAFERADPSPFGFERQPPRHPFVLRFAMRRVDAVPHAKARTCAPIRVPASDRRLDVHVSVSRTSHVRCRALQGDEGVDQQYDEFQRLIGKVKSTRKSASKGSQRKSEETPDNPNAGEDTKEAYEEFEALLQGKRGLGPLARANQEPTRDLTAAVRPEGNAASRTPHMSQNETRRDSKEVEPQPELHGRPEKQNPPTTLKEEQPEPTSKPSLPTKPQRALTEEEETGTKVTQGKAEPVTRIPQLAPPLRTVRAEDIEEEQAVPEPAGKPSIDKLDLAYEVEQAYDLAEKLLESKERTHGKVFGVNAGGVLVRLGAAPAFIPYSQLSKEHVEQVKEADAALGKGNEVEGKDAVEVEAATKERRKEALSVLIGAEVYAAVILVDREKKKIVLSERKRPVPPVVNKEKIMRKLVVGELVEAVVTNLVEYGAFMELQGTTAFTHVNEISWEKISHPGEVLAVGEKVRAQVLNLDFERMRISLSIRRTMPDPLEQTLQQLAADSEVAIDSTQLGEDSIIPALSMVITKLKSYRDIDDILVGRKIHGPAFSPDFQLFMAAEGMKNGHKLVARYENDVQEVIVKTTLSRDSMVSVVRDVIE